MPLRVHGGHENTGKACYQCRAPFSNNQQTFSWHGEKYCFDCSMADTRIAEHCKAELEDYAKKIGSAAVVSPPPSVIVCSKCNKAEKEHPVPFPCQITHTLPDGTLKAIGNYYTTADPLPPAGIGKGDEALEV